MFKKIGNLAKRLVMETTPAGKVIRTVGAVLGVGGGVAVANQFTLTNEFVLDVIVIIAVTVITITTGQAQVPDYLKGQLDD